jgi:hypothetical protein
MLLSITILVAAISAQPADTAKHAKYLEVHHEWQRIHRLEDGPVNAQLIIDPRKHAMWIEKDGKVHRHNGVVDLPKDCEWTAFHITNRGIVELSFPVRITNPRNNIQDDSTVEALWIIGVSEGRSWQFSFSATQSAHTFHVGSGSPIGTITVPLPAKPIGLDTARESLRSFVAPQSPWKPQPMEELKSKQVAIRIVRETGR